MRARLVAATALFLAASAAAWWLLRPRGESLGVADEASSGDGASAQDDRARLSTVAARAPKKDEAAPRGRCSIRGTARRQGAPVAAKIEVYPLSRAGGGLPYAWLEEGLDPDLPAGGVIAAVPLVAAAAAADGTFSVASLEPGRYDVVAVASDGARGSARATLSVDGAAAEANPEIRSGPETLRGRTVRADGTPWKGHVAALPTTPWGETSAYALALVPTGDDGSFSISGLERGRVSVVAFLDKAVYVVFRPVPVPYPAGALTLVVDADLRDLKGRVVDDRDGHALAGAGVLASAWNVGDRSQVKTKTVSDAEGKFRLPVPARLSSVATTLSGYAPASRQVGEGQSEIEVRLVRSARVSGRVTSEADGSPVGGVAVYAVAIGEDVSGGARSTTGPDGRYEIADVRPGSVMVCALGGGWFSGELLHARAQGCNALAVDVPPDGTVTVDLVATKCALAAGRVLDSAEKPVPGATVGWNAEGGSGAALYQFDWVTAASRTATAQDGTFAADALLPGLSYKFHAAAPDQAESTAGPFDADATKPLAVEIRLPASRWLDATVLEEESGRPLPGATVQCWFESIMGANGASGVTGPEGRARVGPLPPGDVWASAQPSGSGGGAWQRVGKDSKDTTLEATFKVHSSHDIRGRLVYPDGAPVDDRIVYLSLTGPNTNWNTSGTLDGGAFEFSGVVADSCRLEVRLEEGQPSVAGATISSADERVTITVPGSPAKRVALTIVDAAGKPVPMARILYAGTQAGTNSDFAYEGKYRLPGILTEAWVEVYAPSSPAGTALPLGALTVGPIPAGTEAKEIRLEGERRIEGLVHGPDGRGVRGVRVRAIPLDRAKAFEGSDTPHDQGLSDADGRFRLGRLWAGDYRLVVEVSEAFAPPEPRVVAAGSLSVDIALLSGFVAVLPVEDWQGSPMPRATVSATIEGRQSVRAVADASGVARLVGLDRARTYRLDVEPPADVPEAMSLSLAEWKPSEEPVRVPRAFAIRGVVRDRDGRAAGGARVTLLAADGGTNSNTQSAGDGGFEFPRLAPGEYRLFAATQGDPHRTSRVVTASSGGVDVALTLDPALELVVRVAGWPAGEGETWAGLRFDGTATVLEWAKVEAGGVLTFKNVHPDSSYALYLRLDSDPTRIVSRRGIAATAGEVRLGLERGQSIRGRLVAPRGAQELSVSVSQEGIDVGGDVDADGRYELKGLPDGTFTVKATATLDGAPLAGTALLAAGATADIELKAR